MTWTSCVECGEPSPTTRCPEHTKHRSRPSTALGYDWTWQKLSKRARRLQPFCSDCGAADDLTADHTPEAWRRRNAGLPIRLEDVDVVCRGCNARRGRARPTGGGAQVLRPEPPGKAKFGTHLGTVLTSDGPET
jgi:5-methylcytosine-specific restriction endonuclease McrA